MFSMLTGQTHDLTWPDSDDSSTNTMISRYGLECNGHGGSDVFPYGLLDTDTDGFEVRICNVACLTLLGIHRVPSPIDGLLMKGPAL